MAMELDSKATRTLAFPGKIHLHFLVPADVHEVFSRGFPGFIHLLKFEGVKPNAAAAALADVHAQSADLDFSQLIETSWAFHSEPSRNHGARRQRMSA